MSASIDTTSLKSFGNKISKYQILLYFLILSALVIAAIILILGVFTAEPENPPETKPALISNDNKETVSKLRSLRASDELEDIPAPEGRFSPFFESKWNTDIMEK
jgi:hypothetical protein